MLIEEEEKRSLYEGAESAVRQVANFSPSLSKVGNLTTAAPRVAVIVSDRYYASPTVPFCPSTVPLGNLHWVGTPEQISPSSRRARVLEQCEKHVRRILNQ